MHPQGEDVLVAADDLAAVDEHRDLVLADRLPHRLALGRLRRHLASHELEPELRQTLPDAVGVGAPLCLVELHSPPIPAAAAAEPTGGGRRGAD